MESVLNALVLLMELHRKKISSHEANKALRSVVDKIDRFDGKKITNFKKVYVCEMEVHQVQKNHMMQTFNSDVNLEFRERIQKIWKDVNVTLQVTFDEKLGAEYYDEDYERVSRSVFIDWVEQQPQNDMGLNELLR